MQIFTLIVLLTNRIDICENISKEGVLAIFILLIALKKGKGMINKYKTVWIIIMGMALNMVLFSAARRINIENPFNNSWYKKALDACMHVWGDVRELNSIQKNMDETQRILCLDALIGRLTQADRYVEHMINGKAVVAVDDIAYFVHILGLLNHACNKLSLNQDAICIGKYAINMDEQVQCLLSVLQGIKKRLESVLGPEFILSKIDQIQQ